MLFSIWIYNEEGYFYIQKLEQKTFLIFNNPNLHNRKCCLLRQHQIGLIVPIVELWWRLTQPSGSMSHPGVMDERFHVSSSCADSDYWCRGCSGISHRIRRGLPHWIKKDLLVPKQNSQTLWMIRNEFLSRLLLRKIMVRMMVGAPVKYLCTNL